MKSQAVFLFGILFFCAAMSVSAEENVSSDETTDDDEPTVEDELKWMEKCRGTKTNIAELIKGVDECSKKTYSVDEDLLVVAQSFCHWKKKGVLDIKGNFSESGCQSYINRGYSEKYQKNLFNDFKKCAKEHSSHLSSDDFHEDAEKFFACLMQAHVTTCMGSQRLDFTTTIVQNKTMNYENDN